MITNKKINLTQLDQELGGYGLSSSPLENGELLVVVVEHSPITENELADAIEKHVAGPTEIEIKMANRQQGIDKLKELGLTDDQISALLG